VPGTHGVESIIVGYYRETDLVYELRKTCRSASGFVLCGSDRILEWAEGDHLCHARFAGLREDKNTRTIVKEHAARSVMWNQMEIPVLTKLEHGAK
jgi:hypothetical protein